MERLAAASPHCRRSIPFGPLSFTILIACLFGIHTSFAGGPEVAPGNGFGDLPWGTDLAAQQRFTLAERAAPIETFVPKEGSPVLGEAKPDTISFVAIHGEFARVVIHYTGQETHKRMLAYLEVRYGAREQPPGTMMRGLNQQYTWRHGDTEVNLTYHAFQERGTIFIESRTLAPRFNDLLPDSAY